MFCLHSHNINTIIINYLQQHIYYLNADNHNIIYCHNNPLIEYILLFKEHIKGSSQHYEHISIDDILFHASDAKLINIY